MLHGVSNQFMAKWPIVDFVVSDRMVHRWFCMTMTRTVFFLCSQSTTGSSPGMGNILEK